MTKKELRNYVRDQKRQYSQKQLIEFSDQIINKLSKHNKIIDAKIIMFYYSLSDEVYTHDIINKLAKSGKTILLPAIIEDNNMIIRKYNNENDLQKGDYNIMEPIGELFENYDMIDVVVVPGMGFDKKNNRLGRGKGYYDRFLIKLKNAYKIGVCFDFQKVEHVPTNEYDVKVDEVI